MTSLFLPKITCVGVMEVVGVTMGTEIVLVIEGSLVAAAPAPAVVSWLVGNIGQLGLL